MKMLIDKIRLKLLLEQKRDYIKHSVEGIDILITAVVYIFSLLCCEFKPIFGIDKMVVTTLAWVFAVIILVYGIYKIIVSSRHRYSHEKMFHEIENLDEVLHKFSIVAVKDSYHEYANKYLLYYDKAWNCWFFFNFPTSEYQNEESLTQRLSNVLKISTANIKMVAVSDRIQPKYSERDHVNKVYQHSLYQGVISEFPDFMKQDEFELEGTKYKWWTISDMETDEEIMAKNKDVVSFVKEKIS